MYNFLYEFNYADIFINLFNIFFDQSQTIMPIKSF